MVDNEGGDLVDGFGYDSVVTAGDTLLLNLVVDNSQIGLRIIAFGTEDKLFYEAIEQVLKFLGVMTTIDNEEIIIGGYLGTQFAAKVFYGV